ncbi:MAG: hypothetical protein HY717_18685 [Planctomycetes bacterium]|nr:hypothetical protein [Planctomycetota bacterium]
MHGPISRWLLSFSFAAAALSAGCDRNAPRLVSAELLEKDDGGNPFQEPVLLVTLDRPAEGEAILKARQIGMAPPQSWAPQAELPGDRNPKASYQTFFIRILAGKPDLQPEGIFNDPASRSGPTGLGVDLGRGLQWVDLQRRKTYPALTRVIWEDRDEVDGTPPDQVNEFRGNLVVDQGDLLHLYFSRPVLLSPAALGPVRGRVLVPEDLILTHPEDRLDDGAAPSVFKEGSDPNEVLVVLGSNPRLTPTPFPAAASREGGRSYSPSSLALNGTAIQPCEKIVERRIGSGAVSMQAMALEVQGDFPYFQRLAERFPDPGPRLFLTATGVVGGQVVLAGGLSEKKEGSPQKPLGQVLLFNPGAPAEQRFQEIGSLSQPRYLHTATVLPGEDGLAGTADDVGIIIAGGTDGNQALADLEAIRLNPATRQFSVEPLRQKLRIQRFHHTATAIPPNRIVFIGGTDQDSTGHSSIIARAEILIFTILPGGKLDVSERRELSTIPRWRHTATALGRLPGPDGAFSILVYGGIGIPPVLRKEGREVYSRYEGLILYSPEIIQIHPAASRPPASLPIAVPFDYARHRYDHQAVLIEEDQNGGQLAGPVRVFISGGSLRPLDQDPDIPLRRHWEFGRPEEVGLKTSWDPPKGSECAHSLVFHWDSLKPGEGEAEIIPSPTGERRVHHALIALPRLGLLSIGGENPYRSSLAAPETLLQGEMYLPRKGLLAPAAVFLDAGRSRFRAVSIPGAGETGLFLFGGTGGRESGEGIDDVEALKIKN